MGVWWNGLPSAGLAESERAAAPGTRQNGSHPDGWSARAVIGLLYAPVTWIMRLIVAIHFRRLRVRHGARFPARGAVLLVANHPATWTDVVVLVVALGRKLHFLAHATLFRPLPRAWVLRLFGALPVVQHGDPPAQNARNEETFRRCRALLARGEVVAVFPEGVSALDRSVGPLRTGAARIALDYISNGHPIAVVPAGIHYADRTAFRADVVVSVGRPLRLSVAPPPGRRGAWIGRLTSRLRSAIAGLIVDLPDPSLRWLAEELAPPAGSADPAAFERQRRLARRIPRLRHRAPRAFAACALHARRHRRLRERLHLARGDLAAGPPTAAVAAATAIVALPALVGLVLNAPPVALTAMAAFRFSDPARVGMARIVAGLVCFAGWYAATAIVVGWIADSPWVGLTAALAAAALGVLALIWRDAWSMVRGPIRVLALQWRRPRLVARLRREREALRPSQEWLLRSPCRRRDGMAEGSIS